MRTLFLGLVALAGCDNVFRLLPLPDPVIDAADSDGSGSSADGPVDARTSCNVGYRSTGDLDSDGIPNATDLCPQLTSFQADADQDGLGDECDPHPSVFGDCIMLLDDFTNLDCWQTNDMWTACGGGLCSPLDTASLELAKPLPFETAELRGTIVSDGGGGPTISLLLNDTQPGPAITGLACELLNSGDVMATSIASFSNDVRGQTDLTINSPAQATTTSDIGVVLAWQVEPTISPYYRCVTVTKTPTVAFSSNVRYPSVAPSGQQASIRTKQVVFHPSAFIGYAFGGLCSD
jgi:hypothetical protein